MTMTQFGFAQLVLRLERERSYDVCVQVAQAFGWSLVEKSGSFQLDIPDNSLLSMYFQLGALVDDLLVAGKSALGWQ